MKTINDKPLFPRRRVVLKLNIGADSRNDLIHELGEIIFELKTSNITGEIASGGYSTGYTMHVSEDESVTHDSYFEAIKAFDANPTPPSP